MEYKFIKVSSDPIEIEYTEDEHNSEKDYEPSFWYNNKRYYINDFTRIHNNPWVGGGSDYPDYIHGIESNQYYKPLFIEIIDGEAVNVYEEREV